MGHTNNLIKNWYEREQHIADIEIEPIIIDVAENSTSEDESDDNDCN